jgi:hypothetical protein
VRSENFLTLLILGDSFEGRPAKPGTSSLETGLGARGRGQTKFAQKILSAQKQPPAPTLFFGNLGFETTVDSIRGLLEAHKEKRNANNNNNNTTTTTTSESAIDDSGANNGDDDDDPWIRKIRMGTFEDSGLCKGSVVADSHLFSDPLLLSRKMPRRPTP